jgi:hypothetical protein
MLFTEIIGVFCNKNAQPETHCVVKCTFLISQQNREEKTEKAPPSKVLAFKYEFVPFHIPEYCNLESRPPCHLIPCLLWNWEVHYHDQKGRFLVSEPKYCINIKWQVNV